MLYMEKNMHDFDEEYVPGVRKKHNPAKWISLGAPLLRHYNIDLYYQSQIF